MKLATGQLAKHLRQGLLPAYLVAGDEPLIVAEAMDEIRGAARAAGFDSRELYVADRSFDWSELSNAGQSLSLFSEKKVIDLRLPTGKPGAKGSEAIAQFLASGSDDNLLLVSAPKLDASAMKTRWVKAIDQAGAVIRVWPVEARELPAWIQSRLSAAGLTASREAVLHLARRVEGNLLAAQQEIEKLSLLHQTGEIGADDIDDAVADSARYNVFLCVDEACAGRVGRALRMLGGVRREGIVPVLLLWSLAREIRQLTAMREQMASPGAASSVMAQFRVWKSRQPLVASALQRVSLDVFYRLLEMTERADRAVKGQSGEDAWLLLTRIVAGLATGRVDLRAA